MSDAPYVVEVVRGDRVESVHFVDVAVVESGTLSRAAGDPERIALWRSSLKPVQASVSMESGWDPAGDDEIAVAAGSHDGTAGHVDVVRRILASAGLDDAALRCPPAMPLGEKAAAEAPGPASVTHNCSGKHAAFLAACVRSGWPLDGYISAEHPMQRAVAEQARSLGDGWWGAATDGCGAVTPAAPLRAMAAAFLAAATGHPRVAGAMRAFPSLVAGDGRLDTDLMTAAPGLVTKVGAEALLCFAHPDAGVGGALKCRDGSTRAVGPVAVAVLVSLGLLEESLAGAHARPAVFGGGRPAGRLAASGSLTRP